MERWKIQSEMLNVEVATVSRVKRQRPRPRVRDKRQQTNQAGNKILLRDVAAYSPPIVNPSSTAQHNPFLVSLRDLRRETSPELAKLCVTPGIFCLAGTRKHSTASQGLT